ncbi:MAG: hypothetical protein NT011_11035 [Kiritimatiellaeota bacterium]|nr:hypothetical protein [Kiritimatiellota bacterium]
MRTILLFFVLFLLVSQARAVKYRTYTLAELARKADVVIVAKTVNRNGVIHANVLRSLKGIPRADIIVDSFAAREEEKAHFNNDETVILFLQKEENGRRLLLGYGDQGKWPKAVGKWPYSDVHVVPIQKVEKAVETLLDLDRMSNPDSKAEKIQSLLSSKDAFDQSCALEYLYASCDQKLKDAVKSEVDALHGASKDKHIQVFCDSVSRTNTSEHIP